MNSRIENGKLTFDVSPANTGKTEKEKLIAEVKSWGETEDTVNVLGINDKYARYEVDDYDGDHYERKIYFPETDSVDRIKQALVYDDDVKQYVDPDAVAEFIYNCIDINALAAVQHIALLYDTSAPGSETKARKTLHKRTGDDRAFNIGLNYKTPLLGVNWSDQSAVIIFIDAIAEAAKEIAEIFALDNYGDAEEWRKEFPQEFEIALVSTLCHEFRHAVYGLNEFTNKDGDDPRYPLSGWRENQVESYGNSECEALRNNPKAQTYIDKMIIIH